VLSESLANPYPLAHLFSGKQYQPYYVPGVVDKG